MKTWLALLLSALASVPASAADKLTLGFMSVLSGPGAVIGNDIRDGMRLGLAHVDNRVGGNARGGPQPRASRPSA